VKHSYTWEDVISLLHQQLDTNALIAATKNNPSLYWDVISQVHVREKKQIDAACRHFARNMQWPKVNQQIALCLFSRTRVARDAAKFLRGRSRDPFLVPAPRCSLRKMLEYLLIDFWRECGGIGFRIMWHRR
jgi:hypothetical protein